jgi:uncharacterized membrane protein YhaH (DUF805 family)
LEGRAVNWSYLFLSFDGRISRQPFWSAFVLVAGLELACHLFVHSFESGERLSAIVSLAFVYPEFAVFAKRGHDRNISPRLIGVFFLVSALMDFAVVLGFGSSRNGLDAAVFMIGILWLLFALALLIELGFRPGTPGPNQYGPDPLA